MHINDKKQYVGVSGVVEKISVFITLSTIWIISEIMDKSVDTDETNKGIGRLRLLILSKYISKLSIDFIDILSESIKIDNCASILSISV